MPLVSKAFGDIITFTRASGATWFNSAGNLIGVDFSTSSNTIGTGSKTFTLNATAGVDRSWATGDTVLIVDQANSANNMTGAVTSYTASTQALVVNVTSTAGSGTITSWRVGNLMQRLDYNPSTLAAQGLLIEEARTNSIRNNTMQGAVAGTPGTAPTNWFTYTALTGLTQTVVGTGTENGITYIDIRINGTPSGAGTFGVYFETNTAIAALNGQIWTESVYLKLQAGTLTGVTNAQLLVDERSSTAYIRSNVSGAITPTTAALNTQRNSLTATLSGGATVANIVPYVNLNLTVAAIDITLRIGLPQLEQGAFATSVIPTTTTALTRSADVASVNTLSPWYNASEGTLFAEVTRNYSGNFLTYPHTASLSDGTNANCIRTGYGAFGSQSLVPDILVSSVNQLNYQFGTFNVPTAKIALAYKTNDTQFAFNSVAQATDTSCSIPAISKLNIGSDGISGGNNWGGWIRRITYYPRRLSNAELQAITA